MESAFQEGEHAGDMAWVNELEIRLWVDGPRRRPEDVDPTVRRRALAMNAGVLARESEPGRVEPTPPPPLHRLGELAMPVLVVTGDQEVSDMQTIAEQIAHEVPGCRRETVKGAGHLIALEQPGVLSTLLQNFLPALDPA
jgi:pimeloyl-ACP methyl ester carboxylesterase